MQAPQLGGAQPGTPSASNWRGEEFVDEGVGNVGRQFGQQGRGTSWGKQRIHAPEDYPKIVSASNEVQDLEILSPNN